MTVEQRIDDPIGQFPAGMRVLAVDDDPTCLKLLETLLRRCQYHGLFCSFLGLFGCPFCNYSKADFVINIPVG